MKRLATFLVTLLLAMSFPVIANGTTRIKYLEILCPSAIQANQDETQAAEAAAVADDNAYKLYRDAARLYYRCSQQVKNPESHDLAQLSYIYCLDRSTKSNGDVLKVYAVLDASANDLIFHTTFQDLRQAARDDRESIRRAYRAAYKAVNGYYPADAPDLDQKATTEQSPASPEPSANVTPLPNPSNT